MVGIAGREDTCPRKWDALRSTPASRLIEHFCPPAGTALRLAAIADAVVADDQQCAAGRPFEHLGRENA